MTPARSATPRLAATASRHDGQADCPHDAGAPWRRSQWLCWTGGLALALLPMALALSWESQRVLFLWLNHQAASWPAALWSSCTLLGDTAVLLALLAPLLLWRPQAWMAALAAVPAGGLYALLGKRLADWPRPAGVLEVSQFTVIGPLLQHHSFPSGHSITAFAVAAAVLATLAPVVRRRRHVLALAGGLGLATAVAASRVAVGAHWPMDVLAGAAGGWLAGLSGALLARWRPRWWQHWWRLSRGRAALVAGLVAVGAWLLLRPLDYPLGRGVLWLAALSALGVAMALARPLILRAGSPPARTSPGAWRRSS